MLFLQKTEKLIPQFLTREINDFRLNKRGTKLNEKWTNKQISTKKNNNNSKVNENEGRIHIDFFFCIEIRFYFTCPNLMQ